MTVTEIKIRKLLDEQRLKGIVSVTFDDMFAVHDIKIVQGSDRLFVAMPSRRDDSGMFRDIVHPMTKQFRRELEDDILDAYSRELDRRAAETDIGLQ
ncbi:MAG: septation regulator SpoVG [Ruminococcus sp.]|nr:septation regulator SpoVG [Ruminococcus sp.]